MEPNKQVEVISIFLNHTFSKYFDHYHGRIQRGGQGVRTPPPPKNHKNIGFLSNTGPDPLKNHKATQARVQFRAIIGTPAKRQVFVWILSPFYKKRKNL